MWKYTRKNGMTKEIDIDPLTIIRLHLVGEEGPGLSWEEIQEHLGADCRLKEVRNSPEWVLEVQRYIRENHITGDTEWLYKKLVPNYRAWEYTRRDGKTRIVRVNPQDIIHSRWVHKVPWSALKDIYGSACNVTNLTQLRYSPEWRTEVENYIRRKKIDPEIHYALKWDLIANYREYV